MTMPNSDNAMHDSGIGYDVPGFGTLTEDRIDDLIDMPPVDQHDEENVDEPDAGLVDPKPRSPKAKQYEKKTRGLFSFAFQMTVRNQRTQADAATILMYGPDISQAVGDLAAENVWAARAVDMLTDTTDNAAAALMMASVPFILQVVRNHEPTVEATPRGIRVPFTKRTLNVRLRFKLRRTRKFTYPPEAVMQHVFTNPSVAQKLEKQGIQIVVPR